MELLIKFVILTAFVSGIIIFFLHRALISSTEGAVQRLNEEIAKANAQQAELAKKLKDADAELTKRQAEAKALAEKMRSDAQEESKSEREKIIADARKEGEAIIAKAQGAKDKIRSELEQEAEVRMLGFSMRIMNTVLSEKARGSLNEVLVDEFLDSLKETDMSRISPDVKEAELITLTPIDESKKSQFSQLIKEKLNREIALKPIVNDKIGGGAILKFGSMALDGSVQNRIREIGTELQTEVDEKVTKR